MALSAGTVANMARAAMEKGDNVALACALSLGIDFGASLAVYATAKSLKPATEATGKFLGHGLDSNHVLLQLVHEVKWQTVCKILEELPAERRRGQGADAVLFRKLFGTADTMSKQQISSHLDARSETVPAEPSRFRNLFGALLTGLSSKAPDITQYSETDRQLVQMLDDTLARESQNRPEASASRQDAYALSAPVAAELVLMELGHRVFGEDGQTLRDRAEHGPSILAEFLARFDDADLGWAATYRVLLKARLADPANAEELDRLLLNFTAEISGDTKTLIQRADLLEGLVLGLSEDVLRGVTRVEAGLESLRNELRKNAWLKLDPDGGDARVYGAERFLDLVYSAQLTDFVGRTEEVEMLEGFLAGPAPVSWWQVSGDGGQGKSRLALELVQAAERNGWHAGFLRAEELSETDWSTLPIDQPTLCVVDYVASPVKARNIAAGLVTLLKRADTGFADWAQNITHPFRLLLVERSPYASPDQTAPALWYANFCGTGNQREIIRARHSEFPVHLNALSPTDMARVCLSWRDWRKLSLPTPEQLQSIIDLLAHTTSSSGAVRAWRPLLAMVMTDLVLDQLDGQAPSLAEALNFILLEEQAQFSRGDPDSWEEARPSAKRMAALATIIGSLNIRDASLESEFYRANDRNMLATSWRLVGYRTSPEGLTHLADFPLPARTPDLLGEYMVHQMVAGGLEYQQVMTDAWRLDPQATFAFLVRLSEDQSDLDAGSTFRALAAITPENLLDEIANAFDINGSAYFGLSGLLNRQLAAGTDPQQEHKNGTFPLLFAAQEGHAETVQWLASAPGIDINKVHAESGTFPLLMAAQEGHAETVQWLASAPGIDINKVHAESGMFPLLMAAQNGHAETVQWLLSAPGIDINKMNPENGAFPLLLAAQNGHAETVQWLLNAPGIDINKVHPESGTFPLLMAAKNGHAETVQWLASAPGIDINKVYPENGTFPLLLAAQNGHAETVQWLLSAPGIDINKMNPENGTFPLLMAAQNGHAETVQLLASAPGIDINKVYPESGTFPLLMAAGHGHTKTVRRLADAGADLDKVWEETNTNSLELCLGLFVENENDPEARHANWRGAKALLDCGATLQDGTIPDLPDEPPRPPDLA